MLLGDRHGSYRSSGNRGTYLLMNDRHRSCRDRHRPNRSGNRRTRLLHHRRRPNWRYNRRTCLFMNNRHRPNWRCNWRTCLLHHGRGAYRSANRRVRLFVHDGAWTLRLHGGRRPCDGSLLRGGRGLRALLRERLRCVRGRRKGVELLRRRCGLRRYRRLLRIA
jgi:hypothetical protein